MANRLTSKTVALPHTSWGRGGSAKPETVRGSFHCTKPSRTRRKPGTTERARSLRRGGNLAEGRLWVELQDRKLGGHKFVRQHSIGPYFADFACREARLVVELDGSQHAESLRDRARDAFMREAGWSVIRFWSHEARSQTRAVC